jgi:hypothetical protein
MDDVINTSMCRLETPQALAVGSVRNSTDASQGCDIASPKVNLGFHSFTLLNNAIW